MENRLTAIGFHEKRGRNSYWLYRCVCGTEKVIAKYSVQSGDSKSCGCLRKELISAIGRKRATHGESRNSNEYKIWQGMLRRCNNKNYRGYKDYGGRGIKVCERWRKFENFLADMGRRPANKTLDRTDNDGDYSPDNCRWATASEQNSNRRSNRYLLINGEKMTVTEAVRRFEVRP